MFIQFRISPPFHIARGLRPSTIEGNGAIKDLSPLSQCPDIEELNISRLPLIEDLSSLRRDS